jgi:hypothetical protein
MPQQNHRFFVVISPLKYTLQNVVFLYTIKANLLFCEQATSNGCAIGKVSEK